MGAVDSAVPRGRRLGNRYLVEESNLETLHMLYSCRAWLASSVPSAI